MANKPSNQATAAFPKGIGNPAQRALVAAGYTELAQLQGVRETELAALHGVGPTALARLKAALAAQGFAFAADDLAGDALAENDALHKGETS